MFMRRAHIGLGAQNIIGIQRPKLFFKEKEPESNFLTSTTALDKKISQTPTSNYATWLVESTYYRLVLT
jgi:hypothetical protein